MSADNWDILVVDDEEGFRAFYARVLQRAGYAVRAASDAPAAFRAIETSAPAVAVCDIYMPGPTGLWLAEQIRSLAPHTAVVLATSDASVSPLTSLQPGIVAYVIKPLDGKTVLKAIADGLAWSAAQRGLTLPPELAAAVAQAQPVPAPPPVQPRGMVRRLLLAAAWVATAILALAIGWYFTPRA